MRWSDSRFARRCDVIDTPTTHLSHRVLPRNRLRRGVHILLSIIADAAATCVGRWLVGLKLGEAVPQLHETVRGPGLTNAPIMLL